MKIKLITIAFKCFVFSGVRNISKDKKNKTYFKIAIRSFKKKSLKHRGYFEF